ncbi:inositol monophosphatase family protein [Mesorhizobium sp. WSM2239]|uniref:Inositol monophosphatase family protein n=2 Tax=unclassified Mesorhizobium TaxID=325217 RepID=A0AAU8D884_9HYPH
MNVVLSNELSTTKVDPFDDKAIVGLFEGPRHDGYLRRGVYPSDEGGRLAGDRSGPRRRAGDPRTASPRIGRRNLPGGRGNRWRVVPVLEGDAILLIDPLDGTKEFINRNSDGQYRAGAQWDTRSRRSLCCGKGCVVLRPSGRSDRGINCAGLPAGGRRKMSVRKAAKRRTIVASRSRRTPETDEFIAKVEGAEIVPVGPSLKFCLLASGAADLYPRFGRTMEWDAAAGDAVLRAAGGRTVLIEGGPLRYGKRGQQDEADFANSWFIADTSPAATDQKVALWRIVHPISRSEQTLVSPAEPPAVAGSGPVQRCICKLIGRHWQQGCLLE